MRDTQLFEQALGLGRPWRVVRSAFDVEGRRLDVYLDFEPGATFDCPACGAPGCKAHDTVEKSWRHLNFFQHEAHLHARIPRVRCAASGTSCGVRLVEVPWARPGSGFTLLFEALVLALVKEMPVQAVARIIGEHDTRIWRIVHHYVAEARSEADFSEVRAVGMDETASKRGQQYITLFMDLDKSRLLFATEGRDASTLSTFRTDLEAHGGRADRIEELCLDMSPAFLKGAGESFPEASLTFDRFHVMQLINKAVDTVRREERKARPELNPELKGPRYVWMKNPENLTKRQQERLEELDVRRLALKTARAYHMRLTFGTCQRLWDTGWAEFTEFRPLTRRVRREAWVG